MRACATKSGYYHFIILSLLRFQLKNIEKKLHDYRKHNTRSVPPRAVVAGNPARVIGSSGAFEIIEYPGMESDPARLTSLGQLARELEAGEPSSLES